MDSIINSDSPKILEVNDLRTRFHIAEGTVYAVNGVSFHLNHGEAIGLVGESSHDDVDYGTDSHPSR
jgi:ABC-type microcin C transport system duplicated ATPase subunit YejF